MTTQNNMCIERNDLIGKRVAVTVRTVPAAVQNDWAGHRPRANWTAHEFENHLPTEQREHEATIIRAAQQAEDKPVWVWLRGGLATPGEVWSTPWMLSEVRFIEKL